MSQIQAVEQPLRFSVSEYGQNDHLDAPFTSSRVREFVVTDDDRTERTGYFLALATDHTGDGTIDRAERAVDALEASIDWSVSTADVLRTGFREANSAVFETGPGNVSLVALLLRDKYASFASIGENDAYLMRSKRLNEITRNQRAGRPASRRGDDAVPTDVDVAFVGAEPRLDSRQPGIFDITLLPYDVVALVTERMAESLTVARNRVPAVVGVEDMEAALSTANGESGERALLLEVLPIREQLGTAPASVTAQQRYVPYIVVALLLLAGLVAALVYFFV